MSPFHLCGMEGGTYGSGDLGRLTDVEAENVWNVTPGWISELNLFFWLNIRTQPFFLVEYQNSTFFWFFCFEPSGFQRWGLSQSTFDTTSRPRAFLSDDVREQMKAMRASRVFFPRSVWGGKLPQWNADYSLSCIDDLGMMSAAVSPSRTLPHGWYTYCRATRAGCLHSEFCCSLAANEHANYGLGRLTQIFSDRALEKTLWAWEAYSGHAKEMGKAWALESRILPTEWSPGSFCYPVARVLELPGCLGMPSCQQTKQHRQARLSRFIVRRSTSGRVNLSSILSSRGQYPLQSSWPALIPYSW